ncbi:hypothetical protein B0T25DRAFT_61260 [Lasiosphaeria hispida]|uniref:Uncharacterized protein n=1 Tax=Lasiosphaeria hispida TaxID=260671 RepID=A0AAJ0HXD8_9PEZI|nr:hypothetical protein B0T25DRAFT_61260 [Lasiosphaeria hispida]
MKSLHHAHSAKSAGDTEHTGDFNNHVAESIESLERAIDRGTNDDVAGSASDRGTDDDVAESASGCGTDDVAESASCHGTYDDAAESARDLATDDDVAESVSDRGTDDDAAESASNLDTDDDVAEGASDLATEGDVAESASDRLGSFQDLVRLLKNLNSNSPREPFGGRVFSVSPAQYRTFLKMELRGNPGPSDYSCGVVYYKKKSTYIHRHLSAFLSYLICEEAAKKWTSHAVVGPLIKVSCPFNAEVRDDYDSPTFDLAPDVAIFFGNDAHFGDMCPSLVAEIAYSHRFTREKLEERYCKYFEEKEGRVKIVICMDLYYGRGEDRAQKTADNLERSAISMWIRDKNGNIQTIMR